MNAITSDGRRAEPVSAAPFLRAGAVAIAICGVGTLVVWQFHSGFLERSTPAPDQNSPLTFKFPDGKTELAQSKVWLRKARQFDQVLDTELERVVSDAKKTVRVLAEDFMPAQWSDALSGSDSIQPQR